MSEGVRSHRDEENPPVRRPGPHGAAAGDAEQDEAVAKAYRRAERATRRSFQEVTPHTVTAAEAVTSIDEEFDADDLPKNGAPFVKSRACFVATAAYGDADAPEVEQLRRFRDDRLLTTTLGTAFVNLYYRVSPPFARLIARKPRLRTAVKRTLDIIRAKAAL